jgi:nitrite reductase (NO-forming)
MKKKLSLFLSLATFVFSISLVSPSQEAQEKEPGPELKASMAKGKVIYESYCLSCHMENGEGIPATFPPLAKSDYLMADRERSIHQVIFGLEGEIVVNEETYDGLMPASGLEDEQVAHVLNYVRNSWGNKDLKIISTEEVAKVRAKADE